MKLQIIGLEGSSGIGKASGKAYEIGQVHSIARLAPSMGTGSDGSPNVASGSMGTTYRCSVGIIKKLVQLQLPFMAEVVVEDVMRFGKREQEVIDVVPVEQVGKKAA